MFPRDGSWHRAGHGPCAPSPAGSLSSSAGPGQWSFVQANFGLNFPPEHIGTCGVCDSWFGC